MRGTRATHDGPYCDDGSRTVGEENKALSSRGPSKSQVHSPQLCRVGAILSKAVMKDTADRRLKVHACVLWELQTGTGGHLGYADRGAGVPGCSPECDSQHLQVGCSCRRNQKVNGRGAVVVGMEFQPISVTPDCSGGS